MGTHGEKAEDWLSLERMDGSVAALLCSDTSVCRQWVLARCDIKRLRRRRNYYLVCICCDAGSFRGREMADHSALQAMNRCNQSRSHLWRYRRWQLVIPDSGVFLTLVRRWTYVCLSSPKKQRESGGTVSLLGVMLNRD